MARHIMPKPPETTAIEHKEEAKEPEGPYEGKIVEVNGQKYRYEKVPTGQKIWDPETEQLVSQYFTLKTWFSHSTDRIGAGPGWDNRLTRLPNLTDDEMLERYGHVFTRDEIFSPSGQTRPFSDEVEGGMPDDIPYYDRVTVEQK